MKHTMVFLSICFSAFSVDAQTNIHDAAGAQTIMWSNNGMIGVNNNNPQYTLDVTGFSSSTGSVLRNAACGNCDLVMQSIIGSSTYHLIGMYPGFEPNSIYIGGYNAGETNPWVPTATRKVLIGNPYYNNNYMSIDFMPGGGVGIGTENVGTNKLAVEGTIAARKVIVTAQIPFPDYVFAPGYRLLPLDSLSNYVRENRHLPEIPSADSIAKKGLDLGDNQTTLVKKMEEMTLYIIEQNKAIKEMQEEINELKAAIRKK